MPQPHHSGNHSISTSLRRLKSGDTSAANEIYCRYFEDVVRLIEKRLVNKRVFDGEDLANEVFEKLIRAIQEDQFSRLHDRNDLWQLLVVFSKRRTVDAIRYLHADVRNREVGESVFEALNRQDGERTLEQFAGPPTYSDAEQLSQSLKELLEVLEKHTELHEIAKLRLMGYSHTEIAGKYSVSEKTIQRKLRLAGQLWLEEIRDE